MAQQEFIPYEQALELKELGFDEECFATIDQTEYIHINGTKYPIRGAMFYQNTDAPLYQQAFRWFREKHNLLYTIEEVWEEDTEYYVVEITTHNRVDDFLQECTYEEAELACLKKLIEIVKYK